jgi:hypothetical protein
MDRAANRMKRSTTRGPAPVRRYLAAGSRRRQLTPMNMTISDDLRLGDRAASEAAPREQ